CNPRTREEASSFLFPLLPARAAIMSGRLKAIRYEVHTEQTVGAGLGSTVLRHLDRVYCLQSGGGLLSDTTARCWGIWPTDAFGVFSVRYAFGGHGCSLSSSCRQSGDSGDYRQWLFLALSSNDTSPPNTYTLSLHDALPI